MPDTIAHTLAAALRRGDWAALEALLAPDITMTEPNGTLHGREAVLRWLDGWRSALPDLALDVISASMAEGITHAELVWHGTRRDPLRLPDGARVGPGGQQVHVPAFAAFTIQQDRITRWSHYYDRLALPRQLEEVVETAPLPRQGEVAASLGRLYRFHFRSPRRERLFLASVSFFFTFAVVRVVVHAIRAGRGPFHNIRAGGRHIHHLVWGILLLLSTGYLWLAQIGTGLVVPRRWMRATAILYGAGSALTLDEFALWLDLQDVYWTREGRISVDAALLFGGLLSIVFWGSAFFRDALRFLHALWRLPGYRHG